MLTTKHFAFAHVPKTGGVFIREVCAKHLPSDWAVTSDSRFHLPFRKFSEEAKRLPAFTLVRNPWDWYASWYHFTRQGGMSTPDSLPPEPEDPNAQFERLFGSPGQYEFKDAVRIVCTGESSSPPDPDWMLRLRQNDRDLYSDWYWRGVGQAVEDGGIQVGRFENLREDFIDFLLRNDIPVGQSFIEHVRNEPRKNITKRPPYQSYYGDELRELVRYKARYLIDRYGYEF